MEKFKIKSFFYDNDVKENVEIIIKKNTIEINYKDENFTEEIQFNEIVRTKRVGKLTFGVYLENKIYGFFESEFDNKLAFENFVKRMESI